MRRVYFPVFLLLLIVASPAVFSQQRTDSGTATTNRQEVAVPADLSGDRIRSSIAPRTGSLDNIERLSAYLSPDYVIGPGDILAVDVRGRVDLHYGRPQVGNGTVSTTVPDSVYPVLPDGTITLPLIGSIEAAGKTISALKTVVTGKLSEYYKHFNVDISVSKPATIKVWISGMVASPGPQILPSSATLLEALLKAEIQATGSTRRVKLTRHGESRVVDVFRMVSRGELQANDTLKSGDEIYVPPAVDWVTVIGEVSRPGKFEMVSPNAGSDNKCCISDLMELCQGLLPTAASSNAVIQRRTAEDNVEALHISLAGQNNPELKPGDTLIIPSIADYQPIIRLVGEFKGDGVYQRTTSGNVLNKSGVYQLASGETVGDVIVHTGGTTPQADLKHAKLERRNGDKVEVFNLDLEKIITQQDKSADAVLQSGDTLVLPALQDKVYVFGVVVKPGGFPYEPDGRLLDYIAQAGGPSGRAKSAVIIVRGDSTDNTIIKADMTKGIKGKSKDNPVMQPGDVVYVPEKSITGWRDFSQIISTIRMLTLF